MMVDMNTLEQAEEAVERARSTYSKQPRFKEDSEFFGSVLRWIRTAELECPDYAADSRRRDTWLRANWYREPHWAGVLNTVILVDSSRGWTMTGGRNQVARFTNMAHNANNGKGWRHFFRQEARSYRVTDFGATTEEGREGRNGPLRALYHVDSARCRWTGKISKPLEYSPAGKDSQQWRPQDFFNVCSLPNDDEEFLGLGYCATSRALDLIKLLYAVLAHDQEQVGARMPKALLFLRNVSETQWQDSMRARDAAADSKNWKYYGGLTVIAGSGMGEPDAKLVALSQLPQNFTRQDFLDNTLAGYALVNGYDPGEFWPQRGGVMGRGKETEVQHQKAAQKGALEFPHAFQERLQTELPDTLEFAFEERDEQGQLLQAEVATAWAEAVKTLYEAGQMGEGALLNRDEARSLLVDQGIIPTEWTEYEEEAQATDEKEPRMRRLRERALMSAHVLRAARAFPAEPIVRHHWPSGREVVLWQRGADALRRHSWLVSSVARQAEADEGAVLYASEDGEVVITEADVRRAIEEARLRVGPEFAALLEAEPEPEAMGRRVLARLRGLWERSDEKEMTNANLHQT